MKNTNKIIIQKSDLTDKTIASKKPVTVIFWSNIIVFTDLRNYVILTWSAVGFSRGVGLYLRFGLWDQNSGMDPLV